MLEYFRTFQSKHIGSCFVNKFLQKQVVVGLQVIPVPVIFPGVVRLVLFNVNDGVALPFTCILKSLFDVL